jgi:outer membrane protein assembly factor BamB
MFIVGGDNGVVAAFNLDTDTLLWSRDINSVGPEGLFGPTHWGNFIVLDFGAVYWTTDDGYVVGANAATGSLWSGFPAGLSGQPLKSGVTDGEETLYYVTGPGYPGLPSGCYLEIRAENGDIMIHECGNMDLQEEFRGGAVYADGQIYANSWVPADSSQYPVDGFFHREGNPSFAVPSNAQTHYGGPMIGGDGQRVFVPTTSQWTDPPLGGQMVAFDITTGDVDWASSSIGGGGYNCDGVLLTDPVGIPQLLYGFSDDGILSCFDPVTGEELYRRRIDHGARSNNTGLGGAAGTTAEGEAHLVFADLYGGLYDFTIQMDRPRLEIQDYTPEETVSFGGPQPQSVVFENLLVNTGGAALVLDSLVVCSCSCDGYLPGSEPYSPIGPERKDSLRADKTAPLDHTRGSRSDPPAWFLGLVSPNADSPVAPGDTADLVILVNPSLLAEGVVVACVQLFSSDPDFFLNDTTQAPEIEITMLCDFENCCTGFRGNVDYDPGDGIDISDLVYLVDYMFTGGSAPSCTDEADIDGSGEIDISDLVYLVDYMFNGGPRPPPCLIFDQ